MSGYDVCVVGAGVVGAAAAWELSGHDLRVLWLEAAHDVAEGASKGNSGITASGYDCAPGTLEADMVTASSPRWEQVCGDLDVPFARIGALALAFDESEKRELEQLRARAESNGVRAEVVDGAEARRLCPAASTDVRAALHVPDEGIIDSLRLVLGYAQVAVRNGAELRLSEPVTGFRRRDDGTIDAVATPKGSYAVRAVVNAAGLGADEISAAAGAEEFRMWPRRGQFLLADRDIGRRVTKVLTPVPTERTRGILAVPTTNGTMLLGPTADDAEDKTDRSTDAATLDRVFEAATRLVPAVERRHVIKSFCGLRPASDEVYRLERSGRVPNLIQAAAIRSTGVSSSPAVAERVRTLLEEAGIEAAARPGALRRLPRVPRLAELADGEAAALAAREEGYRTLVCACEHVSAAELRAALDGPLPATSLDGVRKRTRATAGRCQGAYCSAGVGFMLSLARGLEPWQVPQGEPDSAWGQP